MRCTQTKPTYPIAHTIPPLKDWKTELIYCALSLGSKLTLGLLLYMNASTAPLSHFTPTLVAALVERACAWQVLRFSSFSEAMNDTPANQALVDELMSSPSSPPIA